MSTAAAPYGHAIAAAREAKIRWGVTEWYIVAILLGSGLVFVPGTGAIRPIIRGMPYALSAGILVWHYSAKTRRTFPAIGRWVAPALVLYAVNVFHPLTQPQAGVGTVIFHLSIMGPVFWIAGRVRDTAHFERLLWLVLGASMLNAVVGILQAAFPYIFMPPTLSGHVAVIEQQTYMGPFGQMIVRPPGLSDLPGGASSAGAVSALLGLGLMVRKNATLVHRLAGSASVIAGMFVLFLTQVRAFALMTVLGLAIFSVLAFGQGRGRQFFVWAGGVALLAVLIGGFQAPTYDPANPYAPAGRFQQILEQGIFDAFMSNRGFFLVHTFEDLLPRFPLGAGLGRWGMTREYFGRGTPFSQIWVEIQPTGWLLDGGVLMWILYGGALLAAMAYSFRLATSRAHEHLAYIAAMVLGLQVVIAGSGLAGPVFNTVFGILFWLLTGGLYAAAGTVRTGNPVAGRQPAADAPWTG